MNRELLLRVADHIDEVPESFDLSWWATPVTETARDANLCDTVGCVAGWTVMVDNPAVRIKVASGEVDGDNFHFAQEATGLLELTVDQADILFTNNRWWAFMMKLYGFEPSGEYDGWDGSWVPLDQVPPKAAATILRALADDEINLDGDWSDDSY